MNNFYEPIKNQKEIRDNFNDLPFEVRKICCDAELVTRIRDLQRAKQRLKQNYEREMKFINDKIKNLESEIGK